MTKNETTLAIVVLIIVLIVVFLYMGNFLAPLGGSVTPMETFNP